MVIEIPKGTPEDKVRAFLNIKKNEQNDSIINKFFGKLPDLEDGLKFKRR